MEPDHSSAAETIRFPFLGSRTDGEPFQYILLKVEENNAEIAIFPWFINRIKLNLLENVNLYIPSLLSTEYDFRGNTTATITSARFDEVLVAEVYLMSLPQQIVTTSSNLLSFNQFANQLVSTIPLTDLVLKLIKDSIFLKHGIKIYFKHLIPYFGRIVDYSKEEYSKLKEIFLQDVAKNVSENERKLREMYFSLEKTLVKIEQIPELIDLDLLRTFMESEIHLELFTITFNKNISPDISLLFSNSRDNQSHMIYLNAIKELEQRLYSNYNHIVIAYIKGLEVV